MEEQIPNFYQSQIESESVHSFQCGLISAQYTNYSEHDLLSSQQPEPLHLQPYEPQPFADSNPLFKTKDELKEVVAQILQQIYLDNQMEQFNHELYSYSPHSLCVLVSEICWDELHKDASSYLSLDMISRALALIPPRAGEEGETQLQRDSRTLKRSYN